MIQSLTGWFQNLSTSRKPLKAPPREIVLRIASFVLGDGRNYTAPISLHMFRVCRGFNVQRTYFDRNPQGMVHAILQKYDCSIPRIPENLRKAVLSVAAKILVLDLGTKKVQERDFDALLLCFKNIESFTALDDTFTASHLEKLTLCTHLKKLVLKAFNEINAGVKFLPPPPRS